MKTTAFLKQIEVGEHAVYAYLIGDTLFVGSVGRVDGPRSSKEQLLDSIVNQLLTLPDDTIVYPGHNYGASPFSTIAMERSENPFLNGLWNFEFYE